MKLQRLRDWLLEVRICIAQAELRRSEGEEGKAAARKFLKLIRQRSEAQKQRMEQARFKRIVEGK